ncbi:hypothetical protein DL96DRAFT_1620918 [Flagelloscypha sp. PMI_526]|nr:hypothetical protein DL96DRAFT_1620918 [Flagelloscypha sp. PMI_526]
MKSFSTIVFATLLAVAVNALPTAHTIERREVSSPEQPHQCNAGVTPPCSGVMVADGDAPDVGKIMEKLKALKPSR